MECMETSGRDNDTSKQMKKMGKMWQAKSRCNDTLMHL